MLSEVKLLDELLERDGCRRSAIKPDGHCQFRALLMGMLASGDPCSDRQSAESLRLKCCDWLSRNRASETCSGGMTWHRLVTIYLIERKKVIRED